ncbi:hypothetical protein [Planococcus antarcticus]|uniref:hypothetical protein n=1 Tax=Planococcus antarcticus TaxID=161360 RepID=UPI0012B650C7|nr:hypothetical protein [Planococcus antarcticus]
MMIKFVLMFLGVWIVLTPLFLLFGADPRDIFNIFIATLLANIILFTYAKIRNKRTSP